MDFGGMLGWGRLKTKVMNLNGGKLCGKIRRAGFARQVTSVNKSRLIACSRRSDCGDGAL